VSCADFGWRPGLSDGKAPESSLEAYANAVRLYQSVVLELQDVESQDPVIRGHILERAAEAKEIVNYYRSASRTDGTAH
jgi:hypothetical protein